MEAYSSFERKDYVSLTMALSNFWLFAKTLFLSFKTGQKIPA